MNHIFSLKRLQVLDVFSNRNIFNKQNLSIPSHDFLDVMNEFYKEFLDKSLVVFIWITQIEKYISEIITPWGLCYTFNIGFNHDVLNLNSTSDDFHYKHFHQPQNMKQFRMPAPKILPKKMSTSRAGLWVGFTEEEKMLKEIKEFSDYIFDGYLLLIHNPYELPSKRSEIIKYNPKFQAKVFINTKLNAIDESLFEYEPHE